MTAHIYRLPFSLDPLMAEAKRRMRKRRVLLAILAVLIIGGAAGAAVALTSSSGFHTAAVCTGASAYVYEVPSYPAQTPTAPAWPPGGNDYWGWMFRYHSLKVGDQLLVNGSQWQVTAIAALPHACQPFFNQGLGPLNEGSLAGRLILRPAG
jgi:hypothetical protein